MLEIEESRLERGVRVADRYRLDHVLGEGGMGVVWDAHDESTGEGRALKFIRTEKCGDARSIARLLREAHAASAISHPNVAQVFDVLELPEGTPFLVMERLHGETLKARLVRAGKLSLDELVPIAVAIASGVRAAHALGIIHRDLKPDNVFLLADGRVKVIDFGIAKELRTEGETELTATGAMLGTLHYMAPEQVFGDVDIDERADVWALGVVLYECIAGHRPTEGSGSGQVLKAIMTRTFPPLSVASPGFPEESSNMIALMLARDREGRPSLDDVIETLEGRAPRSALSAKTLPAVGSSGSRRRSLVVATLVGLVGLVGLGAAASAGHVLWPRSESPAISPAPTVTTPLDATPRAPLASAMGEPAPSASAVATASAKAATGPKAPSAPIVGRAGASAPLPASSPAPTAPATGPAPTSTPAPAPSTPLPIATSRRS